MQEEQLDCLLEVCMDSYNLLEVCMVCMDYGLKIACNTIEQYELNKEKQMYTAQLQLVDAVGQLSQGHSL